MKYKIIKSDVFINGELHAEGSLIDLTGSIADSLSDYLLPEKEKSANTRSSNSTVKKKDDNKAKK